VARAGADSTRFLDDEGFIEGEAAESFVMPGTGKAHHGIVADKGQAP